MYQMGMEIDEGKGSFGDKCGASYIVANGEFVA